MRIDSKNSAMLWGLVLIALGSFFFLQATGILGVLSSLVWTLIFAAGASVFLYLFLTGLHERWWAAIPGFTLMGLAAVIFYDNFAPPFFSDIGGAIFLGSIGLGFLAIFFTNRHLWWAVIPGGALMSLAGVVVASQFGDWINPGSVLFIGLGLTFALLGLLSTYLNTNLRWAYIPAAVMLVLGLLVVTPFAGAANYVWALALIGVGAYLVLRQRRGDTSLTPTQPAAPPASTHATAATNNGAADYGQVVDSVATMSVKEREVVDIN
jgi:hypothetical protein